MSLILTRKSKESVVLVVGGEVVAEIRVHDLRSGSMKLAFDCPEEVRVWRREIWDRKIAEQQSAPLVPAVAAAGH